MTFDVCIIGAGAAGLMCALTAGARGKRVLVIDHATKIAEKIRISGGGRCNFTNIHCGPDRFISGNPHFAVSALKRFTVNDFVKLVEDHRIPYHEKTLGQLFCDNSAQDIIDMLLGMCRDAGVEIWTGTTITDVQKNADGTFDIVAGDTTLNVPVLVVATGGLSIPKIGASGFGYNLARQFDHAVVPTRAGLVPLTFHPDILDLTRDMAGVTVDPVSVAAENGTAFREGMLFTHRGLSGPSILQISSYWQPGQDIVINLAPDADVMDWLKMRRQKTPRIMMHNVVSDIVAKRLADYIVDVTDTSARIADLSDARLKTVADMITKWTVRPAGDEGYRTAEVTLGGVDTNDISSKTFESKKTPGLYFIGEVLDVTGHLGGFNFQWAWSSGHAAGMSV